MVPSSTKDLAPGLTFGGYVVRELIGRGGMAAVYRAEHLLLNKPVALKVMDQALVVSTPARQRFLQEGRAAAAIKHPNVVDITDVGVHDGVPYLVMELLEGEDLESYLRKRTFIDDAAAIRLALPLIAALHAAHSSGVVHRDIKPSNIFMSLGPDEQVVPKVLDFGISKVSFEGSRLELVTTPQHQLIGTPRYLPPEALHGTRELGPLSDQYSLGVVLYQCVTGRTPFSGDTLVSLLNSLSRGAFEPPRTVQSGVSPGLDRVITRALSTDPADRFPTIRDMGRALLELAAERTQAVWGQSFRPLPNSGDAPLLPRAEWSTPKVAAPPHPTERISSLRVSGRKPWRAFIVGLALVLLGAVSATFWSARVARRQSELVRQDSSASEVPVAAAATPPAAEKKPEAIVLGLAPNPKDVVSSAPAATAAAPARVRPARPQGRRSTPATRRAERHESEARSSAPPAAASGVASAVPPGMPPEPVLEARPAPPIAAPAVTPNVVQDEPGSTPRRMGANRSPLLD